MNELVHDHDDDGNCVTVLTNPAWKFSVWDVAGIASSALSNVIGSVAGGFSNLSTQFQAMANWSRLKWDAEREHERQQYALAQHEANQLLIAAALDEVVGIPTVEHPEGL